MTAPDLPPEAELIALKTLESRVKAHLAAAKAIVAQKYAAGDSHKFRATPDGLKLGVVLMTDPDPEWRVTDPDVFEAHLRSYPGNLEDVPEIADMGAALEVLTEHAPHVLAFVSRVRADARSEAMAAARAGHDIPGVQRVKPDGVLTVRPDKQAPDAVAELVAAKRLTWDGQRVLEPRRDVAS